MKILFYSGKCEFSLKIIKLIETNNINNLKLINIDVNKINNLEKIPIIIDTDLIQPIKDNDIYDYINNLKYFHRPTNNFEYNTPPKPNIIEDSKAITNKNNNLEIK
jgi:hypothetical protein